MGVSNISAIRTIAAIKATIRRVSNGGCVWFFPTTLKPIVYNMHRSNRPSIVKGLQCHVKFKLSDMNDLHKIDSTSCRYLVAIVLRHPSIVQVNTSCKRQNGYGGLSFFAIMQGNNGVPHVHMAKRG